MREFLAANHVWLSGLFAAAVTTGLSWLIHSRLPRHVGKEDEGWRYVRPWAGYKLIMILLLPIVVFLDYAASQASEDQTAIAFVVAGTLTFGWLFACYDIFVKRIRFNAEEIQAIHPFWHRTIKWGPEVTGRYYQWLDMGCVRAADGRRIWLMPFGGTPLLARYGRTRERRRVLDDVLHLSPGGGATTGETVTIAPDDLWTDADMQSKSTTSIKIMSGHGVLWCAGHEKLLESGWNFTVPGPARPGCVLANVDQSPLVVCITPIGATA